MREPARLSKAVLGGVLLRVGGNVAQDAAEEMRFRLMFHKKSTVLDRAVSAKNVIKMIARQNQ